jgi:hypothetical protein
VSGALELEAIKTPGLTCAPSFESEKLTVVFTGTADGAAIELLGDYLKRLHSEAERLLAVEVTCDFRQLSFMNSSCFKAFVVWIDTVKNATRSYRIRFLTDPGMHWQRRSLEALRRLAADVVSLDGG